MILNAKHWLDRVQLGMTAGMTELLQNAPLKIVGYTSSHITKKPKCNTNWVNVHE